MASSFVEVSGEFLYFWVPVSLLLLLLSVAMGFSSSIPFEPPNVPILGLYP